MSLVGIFEILGGAAAVLALLGLAPNVPRIVAKIKERLGEPRRKRRELQALVRANHETTAELVKLVKGLLDDQIDLSHQIQDAATAGQLMGYRRQVDAKLEGYEGNQTELRKEVEKLRTEIAQLVAYRRKIDAKLEGYRLDQATLEEEVEELQTENAKLAERLASLEQELAPVREQLGLPAPAGKAEAPKLSEAAAHLLRGFVNESRGQG